MVTIFLHEGNVFGAILLLLHFQFCADFFSWSHFAQNCTLLAFAFAKLSLFVKTCKIGQKMCSNFIFLVLPVFYSDNFLHCFCFVWGEATAENRKSRRYSFLIAGNSLKGSNSAFHSEGLREFYLILGSLA